MSLATCHVPILMDHRWLIFQPTGDDAEAKNEEVVNSILSKLQLVDVDVGSSAPLVLNALPEKALTVEELVSVSRALVVPPCHTNT